MRVPLALARPLLLLLLLVRLVGVTACLDGLHESSCLVSQIAGEIHLPPLPMPMETVHVGHDGDAALPQDLIRNHDSVALSIILCHDDICDAHFH